MRHSLFGFVRLAVALMMGSSFTVAVSSAACGRDLPSDGPGTQPIEAGNSDAPGPLELDGGPNTTARCAWDAPFTSIRRVPGVNSGEADHTARMSPSELVMFFARTLDGGTRIFRAQRDWIDAGFDDSEFLQINFGGLNVVDVAPSPDELTLYLTVKPDRNTERYDVHVMRRPSIGVPFSPSSALSFTALDRSSRFPSASMMVLGRIYFSTTYPLTTSISQLTLATVDDAGADASLAAIPGLEGSREIEEAPVMSADEKTIYFLRKRVDANVIVVAHRESPTEVFLKQQLVPELSPDAGRESHPTALSLDQCRLYFDTDGENGVENKDIYVAERFLP